jgi:two-component system, OmpR family, response regulator ResD
MMRDLAIHGGSHSNGYDNLEKDDASEPEWGSSARPVIAGRLYTQVVDARILVVEDDPTVAEVVVDYLSNAGLEPRHVMDGLTALETAATWRPDLVILDLMLPGADGIEVCRSLREGRDPQAPLPVIMLTALGEEGHRVRGLESGADDYVTKPFSPRELTLRVQAVLRRARAASAGAGGQGTASTPPPVRSGRLEIDVAARRARLGDRELELTVREFDLLAFLVCHPGRAFTRAELLEHVWGWSIGDLSTITVYVRRLREKVEREPTAPVQLQTVWGVGYRWEASPQ